MIRVLRLMEYEFKDYETMEKHMGRLGAPLNGFVDYRDVKIRSCSIDSFEKDTEKTRVNAADQRTD